MNKIANYVFNILILTVVATTIWSITNKISSSNSEIKFIDVGQVWEYDSKNPYQREINSVLVLSKKEGYVEYKVVLTNEVRSDNVWNFCASYNKVSTK